MATATATVSIVGTPTQWSGFKRYNLSNGWFIDGAQRTYLYHGGYKYSLWEPGGHPSGCAAQRGGAPTLALALAVANGGTVCGRADFGCRKLATTYRTVTVRGTEGQVYHCPDHAGDEEIPICRTPTGG